MDKAQIVSAVKALKKHLEKIKKEKKAQLIDDDQFYDIQVTFTSIPKVASGKPHLINIPNPFLDPSSVEVCVFTKDPQSEYKAKFALEFPSAKVIAMDKLRKNYKTYEMKRKLANSYELFFNDVNITPLLPPYLGKAFFTKKKQPAAIKIETDKIAKRLEKAITATRVVFSSGACVSIRVGNTSQTPAEVAENVLVVMEKVMKLAGNENNWDTVRCVSLKSTGTISLPIYNSLAIQVAEEGKQDEVADKEEEQDSDSE